MCIRDRSNIDVIYGARPIKYLDVLVNIGGLRSSHLDEINVHVVQKREAPDATIINLNVDSVHRINSLPAISMKKALAIIEGRPYTFLEDITDIKGISDKTVQELIGLVKPDSINAISDFGNPIDLNKASFQDLLSIPFVSSNTATILQKNTPIDFLDDLKPLLSQKELLRI